MDACGPIIGPGAGVGASERVGFALANKLVTVIEHELEPEALVVALRPSYIDRLAWMIDA